MDRARGSLVAGGEMGTMSRICVISLVIDLAVAFIVDLTIGWVY